jgi:hypothetical protein
MSPGRDALTGPARNMLYIHRDSLMDLEAMFQNGKGLDGKRPGKAGKLRGKGLFHFETDIFTRAQVALGHEN